MTQCKQRETIKDSAAAHNSVFTSTCTEPLALFGAHGRMAQARRWVFTLNNPDPAGCPDWDGWEHLRFAVCQLERGQEGTLHLQGYCSFGRPVRLGFLRNILPRAHWEVARGNEEQCVAYCSKEDTRVDGPWRFGTPQGQGKRNDLEEVKRKLDEGASMETIANEHFTQWVRYRESFEAYKRLRPLDARNGSWKTELIVLCGPSGTGKSRLAAELAGGDAYYFNAAGGKWWDGYSGQRVVVMDDFVGTIPFTELLRLADRYPHQVEVKGGTRIFSSKAIIITSNKTPNEWYDNTKNHMQALYRRIDLYMWMDESEEASYCMKEYNA